MGLWWDTHLSSPLKVLQSWILPKGFFGYGEVWLYWRDASQVAECHAPSIGEQLSCGRRHYCGRLEGVRHHLFWDDTCLNPSCLLLGAHSGQMLVHGPVLEGGCAWESTH